MSAGADPLGQAGDWEPPLFALGALVYAERDGKILLLKRAMGALAGQWYLPGGAIDAGETPEEGARRELREEAGLEVDGELELIGAYLTPQYGRDWLFLSYRGRVPDAEVVLSAEHDAARWVDPNDMRAVLTDDFINGLAAGHDGVAALVRSIRSDLDRYLRRISTG